MDIETNNLTLNDINVLDYWKQIPVEDISALMLYQKIDHSIGEFIEILDNVKDCPDESTRLYFSYIWSISIRDFTLLLRDTLLASAKYEQLNKDSKTLDSSFLVGIQQVIQKAAKEIEKDYKNQSISTKNINEWQYQRSPIVEVDLQLKELEKQCKKIYRSISKIDNIRSSIGEYIRDFQLQYSIQTSAIQNVYSIVEDVKDLTKTVSNESTEIEINGIVDQIGDKIQDLESIQNTESIDIFPYPNKETLILPVTTEKGNLRFKTVNVKSELARWFSSFIYPKIIELERKRDHGVEKTLLAFRQIQTKIAAITIAEINDSSEIQKEFETIFKYIDKDVIDILKAGEEANNKLVTDHINHYLLASKVYSKEMLFLPESGNSQISNISKDAQKRIVSHFDRYKKETKSYVNRILSRYIEVDQTSYSQYIKNKLAINSEDATLALFLKNGYLGKSFTVARPEIINSIVEDYHLWEEGFTGAILLSGLTGSGKSTILGMLNHLGLNDEIIQLKMGESYFVQHRSYETICDLKELTDLIIKKSFGRRIIICIDDLEQWHDEDHDLFANINRLFYNISKNRKKIFFVVSCSSFLKERLQVFLNLKPVFSSQIEMGVMHSNQIKMALNLRARVKEIEVGSESEIAAQLGNIVRESKGNPGFAMLEHCRFHNEEYKSNVKSQEFTELINTYQAILTYLGSCHNCSIKFLSDSLSEIDFRNTIEGIDHLVSQKVLTRPKKGYISINPLLVHTIEKILLKV